MKRESRLGYVIGLGVAVAALLVLILPETERLRAPGPMNTGHDTLVCQDCHRPAPGTLRQQLQANVRHWLGWRAAAADVGHIAPSNVQCLGCHSRPDDAHSVGRFFEPRFERARRDLGPERCVSCHREHNGARVTVDAVFCRQCHQTLNAREERLDIPHVTLVARGDWPSCLGCHDYHGNHVMKLRTRVAEAIPPETLAGYFHGGPSPYSSVKKHAARRQPP